jgi:hypothetical protein
MRHTYPEESLVQVADFFVGSDLLIGAKNRISGVRMVADVVEWSHAEGSKVTGPLLSLIMAMTGRSAHLADLSGDGLPTPKARF